MELPINPIYTNIFLFKEKLSEKDLQWGFV
jgi:hypothetical protein